jgi:hypothetical protein
MAAAIIEESVERNVRRVVQEQPRPAKLRDQSALWQPDTRPRMIGNWGRRAEGPGAEREARIAACSEAAVAWRSMVWGKHRPTWGFLLGTLLARAFSTSS